MKQAEIQAEQCPLCGRHVRIRADGLLAWHLSITGPTLQQQHTGSLCTGALKSPTEAAAIQNWRLASDKVLDGVLADLGGV
jgi:hypothetical protein